MAVGEYSESGFAGDVLRVEHLTKVFAPKSAKRLKAVDDVSFHVPAGGCVGIVGESGSGKSTLARLVLRLENATSGSIALAGRDITHARGRELRAVYREVQAVFQNPAQSFDPRRTIGASIGEGLRIQGASKHVIRARAEELLASCGVSPELVNRYPHEVSGGQCQRAAIVRALMASPSLLICDEMTSALDTTVQVQVVRLLRDVQRRENTALVFITHDIALASQICDSLLVMRAGRVVEAGAVERVLASPHDAYTRALIDAVL